MTKGLDLCHWGQECDRPATLQIFYGEEPHEWVGGCIVCAPEALEDGCRTSPLTEPLPMSPETKDVLREAEATEAARPVESKIASQVVTCGCERPDIYSRHSYLGDQLTRGLAYCKNCDVAWNLDVVTQSWVQRVKEVKVRTPDPDACCANESRNMNGGCDNCGDPCL